MNPQTDTLDVALSEGIVAIGELILLEVLQDFKTDKDFRSAKATLGTLEQYEMFNRQMALRCADNYRALRRKGITVRGTADVIIARGHWSRVIDELVTAFICRSTSQLNSLRFQKPIG